MEAWKQFLIAKYESILPVRPGVPLLNSILTFRGEAQDVFAGKASYAMFGYIKSELCLLCLWL